ncbi:hypothetical protein EDC96DRAFT_519838 [Choanephora cucurbitarum]|nr:hypothetical protein EDC96DRAFT_519838 [Choanephora cucurbitarum]
MICIGYHSTYWIWLQRLDISNIYENLCLEKILIQKSFYLSDESMCLFEATSLCLSLSYFICFVPFCLFAISLFVSFSLCLSPITGSLSFICDPHSKNPFFSIAFFFFLTLSLSSFLSFLYNTFLSFCIAFLSNK